jgi:hypothetical protein
METIQEVEAKKEQRESKLTLLILSHCWLKMFSSLGPLLAVQEYCTIGRELAAYRTAK